MKHGTFSGYTNGQCRCDDCRAAHAAHARDWRRRNPEASRAGGRRRRERLAERIAAGDPTVQHASTVTYSAGCRCEPCLTVGRAASRDRMRRYRQRQRTEASS